MCYSVVCVVVVVCVPCVYAPRVMYTCVWSLYGVGVVYVVHVWFCGVAYGWGLCNINVVCVGHTCMDYHGMLAVYVVSVYSKCVVCDMLVVYVVYMWSGLPGVCVCVCCTVIVYSICRRYLVCM